MELLFMWMFYLRPQKSVYMYSLREKQHFSSRGHVRRYDPLPKKDNENPWISQHGHRAIKLKIHGYLYMDEVEWNLCSWENDDWRTNLTIELHLTRRNSRGPPRKTDTDWKEVWEKFYTEGTKFAALSKICPLTNLRWLHCQKISFKNYLDDENTPCWEHG